MIVVPQVVPRKSQLSRKDRLYNRAATRPCPFHLSILFHFLFLFLIYNTLYPSFILYIFPRSKSIIQFSLSLSSLLIVVVVVPMAFGKASMLALMVACVIVLLSVNGASAQAESPAPSPASPAVVISPSFVSAFFAAFVALVLGSSIKV